MRKPSRWIAQVADVLLSRERKRRIRLIQTGIAILMTLSGLAIMQYAAWRGFVSWQVIVPWTTCVVLTYVGLFLAIRCGWSERLADPSLTVVQMVYGIVCCASAYAIAGALRTTVFPLVMVVLMFGMFALTPRRVLAVSVFAVALFGAVMWWLSSHDPATFPPAIEWGHFLILATMMPTASMLAGQLSSLRARLQQQKRDLADALERIRFLATRDDLTGLVNRRHMAELLEKELLRSQRSGARFCVALIDLDHFKRINDSHGHGVGDEVLQAFAQEGLRLVRAADSLGRWGGEEFLLLMLDAPLPLAAEGVERLRRAVKALPLPVGDTVLHVTLSAGVVEHVPGESVVRMVERADVALYRAKSQGRDQVMLG